MAAMCSSALCSSLVRGGASPPALSLGSDSTALHSPSAHSQSSRRNFQGRAAATTEHSQCHTHSAAAEIYMLAHHHKELCAFWFEAPCIELPPPVTTSQSRSQSYRTHHLVTIMVTSAVTTDKEDQH
jgi:hypothetical protein